MNYQDSTQVARWLNGGASLWEVERVERYGLVGNERFSEQALRAFTLAWTWSGFRVSSAKQERFWRRRGDEATQRRIQRCRRMVNRFLGHSRLFPDA